METDQVWRVAAIRFLNTAPLMWGLEHEPHLDISYTVPSHCARQMREGQADIGIIPVIEMARIAGLAALPGIGITAREQVRSILLISRVAPANIQRLALDSSSRTSAALVQILLRQYWKAGEPQVREAEPDWREMLRDNDAALVIGDPALQISVHHSAAGYQVFDLAQVWQEWTGLPFVFALWAVRREAIASVQEASWLSERFQRAKVEGMAHIPELAATWAPRMQLPVAEVLRYLQHNVVFDVDTAAWAGLTRFFKLAAEQHLIARPDIPELLLT